MPRIEFFERHTGLFGSLGAAMAILMFVALLEVFVSNWQGHSAIWMQPLATLINCVCWLGYGIGKRDWFVVTPQLFGIVLAIATLIAAL